jgi:peptide/nickel transport system substrate-binding protein
MKLRWKAFAAVAAAALVLTGCSSASDPTAESTLTLGANSTPPSFDTSAAMWGGRSIFYQAAFDSLLRQEPDGTLIPGLATSWTYDDAKTTLRMTLRDDVTFTDGSAFDAEVARQNLLGFRDGDGGDAVLLAAVADVTVVDEYTIDISLSEPDEGLLMWLSKDAGLQQSSEAMGNADLATNPVGSGPYVLDTAATVTGSRYVYSKNDDYWDPSVQQYDNVVINVYSDATAALNAIKADEVNGAAISSNANLAEVESAGFTISSNQVDLAGIYFFDREGALNPAMADVRVRQAINYAFDREGLLAALEGGHGTVTEQIFPERSVAFDPELDETYAYDPDEARRLLAEAGFADGLTIDLPVFSGFSDALTSLITQQLSDVGISVTYTDTGNNFIADLLAQKYVATYIPFEQQDDWAAINLLVAQDSFFNPFKNVDPAIEEMLSTIQYGSEADRTAALKELNVYLVDNAWFAPWFRLQNSFATDSTTSVEMQTGSVYPSLFSFRPKD